jgi:hypothetical protein
MRRRADCCFARRVALFETTLRHLIVFVVEYADWLEHVVDRRERGMSRGDRWCR